MADKLTITVLEDGPYKVENARSVRFGDEVIPSDGEVWLCRCGQTSNPPFCDSTHRKVGFSGTCESARDRPIKTWEGRTIRTHFNANACMHVFACQPLKALRAREREGDDAAAAEIAEVVRGCPSGALTYEWIEAREEAPEPDGEVDVLVMEGGEIRVQCAFEINEDLQERQRAGRATLCRCGLSSNKPWCDGKHKKREDFR